MTTPPKKNSSSESLDDSDFSGDHKESDPEMKSPQSFNERPHESDSIEDAIEAFSIRVDTSVTKDEKSITDYAMYTSNTENTVIKDDELVFDDSVSVERRSPVLGHLASTS